MKKNYFLIILTLIIVSGCSTDNDDISSSNNTNYTIPIVSINAISDITESSANSGGNVTNDGGKRITAKGICWSTIINPDINDNKTNNGTGTIAFSSQLMSLIEGTTYYVRAYATNSEGTAYSNTLSFTTLNNAIVPIVTIIDIIDVTQNTATSGGNITDNGGAAIISKGICWSTSPNPEINDNKSNDGNGNDAFTSQLTSLLKNTTYYVRAYATNSEGTAYSEELNFTTLDNVFNGNVILRTQEEVDDFGIKNYEEVTGILIIRGGNSIIDLAPLSSLVTIGELLNISECVSLSNLNGLNNISTIGLRLEISQNVNLNSIADLSNLSFIGEDIVIYQNSSLINLDGLNSITSIPRYLKIRANNKLENIDALSNVMNIGGEVEFLGNDVLMNLNGLQNTTSIGNLLISDTSLTNLTGLDAIEIIEGDLTIRQNIKMINLDGLNNLKLVGRTFVILDNNAITSINGLNSLSAIGNDFEIRDTNIENLNGLSSLSSIGGKFELFGNDSLVDFCELQVFLSGDGLVGNFVVMWNKFNPTKQDIIDGNCSQ